MVFQNLSSIAWLAVIVLQAFIHFVVGPRYKVVEDENDDREASNEVTDEISSTPSSRRNSKLESVPSMMKSQTGADHSQTIQYTAMNGGHMTPSVESLEPDERDSVDDIRQMQNGNERSQPLLSFSDQTRASQFQGEDTTPFDSDKSTNENGKESSVISNPMLLQRNQQDTESSDDCIDDDEEWRYQLIKDYYSTSYHGLNNQILYRSSSSLLSAATSSNVEDNSQEAEDPALLPVGTINTLSEKLNQQRMLAKLQYDSQQRESSRSVSFELSPVSVIASY